MKKLIFLILIIFGCYKLYKNLYTTNENPSIQIEQKEKLIIPNDTIVIKKEKPPTPINTKTPLIQIEQKGKLITHTNNVFSLNKDKFNIIFNLPEPMGLLINSSFNKEALKLASENGIIAEPLNIPGIGLAEGLLNDRNEIFITNTGANYWFYNDEDTHRFNTVTKTDSFYRCTRTIENINDLDTKINIKVKNINSPIYIIVLGKNKQTDNFEINRYLTLEWIK